MKLIIFIPAYNEEKKIGEVIKGLPKKLDGIDEIEVLVVNDGSTDNTVAVAKKAGAIVISNPTNLKLGPTFRNGLEKALELGADILVNIDADGQFASNDIEKLINPILVGEAEFVSGDRFTKNGKLEKPENMSPIKFWGNLQMSKLVSSLSGLKFNDVSCGFRAYSKEAMLKLNLTGKYTYTQESFLDLSIKGITIKMIPVEVKYFTDRKSKIAGNILKYAFQTSWIILRTFRDYSPMRFFGIVGLFFFILGILSGIFVLQNYIRTESFTPYISLAFTSAYLVTIGFIFWIIGLMADMLDRIRLNQEKILYLQKKQQYEK